MPTFGGVTGRVYRKAWRVSAPGPRQWSSCTASASTRALYDWLGNALNGAGTDCGRDKIGYGLTKGDLRLRHSIVRVRQLRPAPLLHRPRPARRIRSRPLRSKPSRNRRLEPTPEASIRPGAIQSRPTAYAAWSASTLASRTLPT
jgi:hypothetical protein